MKRRNFIKVGGLGLALGSPVLACTKPASQPSTHLVKPVVVSTWRHGLAANQAAWEILDKSGRALDAVEAGVKVVEADPKVRTVGIGSYPDRDGHVTLDACIMNEKGDCGSVAFVEDILHPISLARQVMEQTPHVMLAGAGAKQFALEQGFETVDLLTDLSRQEWEAWKQKGGDARIPINIENHDTIGLVALDKEGNLSGACTTSGARYKYHGRIGDSPIIGAGLYVDNAVGAATATGWGEAVIRAVGCFLVVEFMRQGHAPEDACRMAVERVIEKNPDWKEIQVGFLALNKAGEYGAYCIAPGFDFAVQEPGEYPKLVKANSRL